MGEKQRFKHTEKNSTLKKVRGRKESGKYVENTMVVKAV